MKEVTLQTLITVRTLLEQVERHCAAGDRYSATSGLIVLQDATELAFLAMLIEQGVDENISIEKLDFDATLAALGKVGVKVPKTGTLKAMNKLRVTAKHYAQLMEPQTVQAHLNNAKFAIDEVLMKVVGSSLQGVFLTELLPKSLSRSHLEKSTAHLAGGEYMLALIETRKAFFIEFERSYSIFEFRNGAPRNGLLGLYLLGNKSVYWKQSPEWIEKNVFTPFDYIQIHNETWRVDAMEWGINTQTLNNIRRLTPEVIQLGYEDQWLTRIPTSYESNCANKENAAICLDLTIEVIRRKRDHIKSVVNASQDKPYDMPTAYTDQPLFKTLKNDSEVLYSLQSEDKYSIDAELNGFDPDKAFYEIKVTRPNGQLIRGYIEKLATPLDD